MEKKEEIPKALKKNFRKIYDPNYSLFDVEYNNYKRMLPIFTAMLFIGLVLFIVGLIILIRGNILGIIPITFGGMGVLMLIYTPILIMMRAKFKPLLVLREKKQINGLLELTKKYGRSFGYQDQEKARLATYILVDMKSLEIALLLKERIMQPFSFALRDALKCFHLLAIKLGYNDHISFYNDLIKGKYSHEKNLTKEDKIVDEIVIPIKKIYFLEEIPIDARCMISGTKLNFFMDDIVVCPYCSAWAKKNLIEAWLKEKHICPVCRRNLIMDDCPDVRLSK